MGVETDRSRVFVFIDYILSEIYYTNVAMMRNFCLHVCEQLIDLRYEIV